MGPRHPQAWRADQPPTVADVLTAAAYIAGSVVGILIFLAGCALLMSAALEAGR
jgi:hypothetical protein